MMKRILLIALLFANASQAGEIALHVTGFFSNEREADLREAVEKIEKVEIKSIDFEMAIVTFGFETEETDSEKIRSEIDNKLKNASNHTFSVIFPSPIEKEKLKHVEIAVVGLDCKACSYAIYRAIYQIEGVVRATASFKEGKVTALIDPEKTNRAALVEALTKRNVTLAEEN
jgi:copper chaperone CopZ